MQHVRSVAAWVGVGLLLCDCTLACGPSAAPATTPTVSDPFAVVRATSEAAYASGKAHFDRGEFLLACVDLDAAKTNDPDNRPEIQQALEQALQRCLTPPPEATSPQAQARPSLVPTTVPPAAAATTQATLSVAIGAAASTTVVAQTTPGAGQATPGPPQGVAAQSTPAAASKPTTVGSPVAAAPATGALVTWNDPQGRFSVGAPADWTRVAQPQSLFGTSVVEFRDPSGRAEVDVAVDTTTRAVSPELYAASMELAMQQQVQGYASEQVQPGTTAGNPSVRRVFTFTQSDASGQDHQARGFQLTLVRGSTPYIVAGSAPAEQFQQFSPTFDQVVESFRFS
jgi:hypothetical protein